jgi:hypothetical protein
MKMRVKWIVALILTGAFVIALFTLDNGWRIEWDTGSGRQRKVSLFLSNL